MPPLPPPLDPELAAALEQFMDAIGPGFTLADLPSARRNAAVELLDLTMDGAFVTEDRTVPGPDGAPGVPLLVCRPSAASPAAALPVIYHAHGGGLMAGSNRAGVTEPLAWARELNAVVVSVEYRLAPEHPYPAPVEDAYAGLLWTAEHAREIGGDPDRILVTGSSAGGGLAAALALLSRDRQGPRLIGQLLMYPMLDDRNDTVSSRQMDGLGLWDRTANETAWTALLGDRRGGPDVPQYAAPARATDLSELPPAFLDVGSMETFRDEVVTYASRIWQAGGVAELHVWPGGCHGFDALAPEAALSRTARAARVAWLRRLLAV
ncbi:alpha/beta hydrolase fold domain-containing protein [Streptomyces sp. SID486]|uniref:alpha/beta hydrolase n=1 Tax=unclassified Streptomyces TaxID=2593676 RepID=UPI00136CA5B6|nr:alpha/beta hydrolase fold domain-containing protein [Streptomyces sp. SID486]MYW14645.1 alpha/beta hydrolase fold domain-containing protein [Streptomyces sp. SID2955]MYX99449.1 alpha/beta hydrolase fold domain-containing protein [Streptomyces sp. SID486]